MSLQCHEAAYTSFQRAVALDASYTHAFVGAGNALWHLSRYAEALMMYEQALSFVGSTGVQVGAWQGKAATLVALDRPGEAESAYLEVLKIKPGSGEALRGLGDILRMRGDYAGALNAYQSAVNSSQLGSETLAMVWNEIGVIYIKTGDFSQALSAFDRGIAADTFCTSCWLNKAAVMDLRGKPHDAGIIRQQFAQLLLKKESDALVAKHGITMSTVGEKDLSS